MMMRRRLKEEKGVSLIEVLIGVVILAIALLGLAAAGGVAARQVYNGRLDMARWAAIQEQIESLVAVGYDSISGGSGTVQGYPMTWTVTGTDPKEIMLVITRENYAKQTVQDTLITYMANPN
jgi:prepilin-type N-terminal cleavage/methylation domain-containing protein